METEQLKQRLRNNTRPISYKAISAEETEIDENAMEARGYLAGFDNRDLDGDIILKGAFAKTIKERGPKSSTARKIAYLWNHDIGQPLGVFTDLWEDSKGLAFIAKVDDTTLGRETMTRYKSGSVNNHSIGHVRMWDKIDVEMDNKGVVTCYIKEVNLFEGSATTLGVNENTPYTGKKSLHDDGVILSHETEKFLKQLTPELEYTARQLISKHIALTEAKPLTALEQEDKPQFDINTAIKNLNIQF